MSFLKHTGLNALGVAALAATALGACGGSGSANDELPLIRATLSVKTVSQGGVCEGVRVRLTPKELIGKANKYANNRMMVTEVNMSGPTDENGAPMCNGTGETLPIAPGIWEFSAPLASGTTTCQRNIQADGDLSIVLIDGIPDCSGVMPPESGITIEGETPAEGEAPADSAPPPAG
jgi:hypothetical protein